ncbi:hypothetical protein ACWGJB_23730 [Streptomyces sp. NPDC054813]
MRAQQDNGVFDRDDILTAAARVVHALGTPEVATVEPGSEQVFEQIEQTVRGHLPEVARHSPERWRAALRKIREQERWHLFPAGRGWLATALAGGEIAEATFVECGCERIRISRVTGDTGDAFPSSDVLFEAEWDTLPAGAGDRSAGRIRRLFELASGKPTAEEFDRTLGQTLARARRRLPEPLAGDIPLVVAVRAAGWTCLEQAVERLAPPTALLWLRLPAGWPDGPDDLLAPTPLRRTLWFAAARVQPSTGAVQVVRQPLFWAGSTAPVPGRGPAEQLAEVQVQAHSDGGEQPHAGAVVVTGPVEDAPADWHAVRADRLVLPATGQATLRYRLDGPGRVRLLYEGGHRPESTAWTTLVDRLPRRLAPPIPLDLVLAVETAVRRRQGAAQLAARVRRAKAVVEAVRDGTRHPESLRVALIGYRDHMPLAGPGDTSPLHYRTGFCPVTSALRILEEWEPSPLHHDFATGLEHVPHELHSWQGRWRPGSLRGLIVVGSRPPHPHSRQPQAVRRRAPVRVCPDRLDWVAALARLRHEQQLSCLALVDEPDWMDDDGEPLVARWARQAWAHIGAQGCFDAHEDPERVVTGLLLDTRAGTGDAGLPGLALAAGRPERWLPYVPPQAP